MDIPSQQIDSGPDESHVITLKQDTLPQFDTRGAISRAIRQVVNLAQVAGMALDSLAHHFAGADLGLALQMDDEGLRPIWARGEASTVEDFQTGAGLLWRQALEAYQRGETVRSRRGYAVPIRSGGRLLGALICSAQEDRLTSLVDFIADELGQAAARLDEIAEVHRLSRELAILNSVAKALTSSLELETVLTATMQGVRELFNVEVGSLALLDSGGSELVFRKALTREHDWVLHLSTELAKGVVGDTIRRMESSLVNDVTRDARFAPDVDGVDGVETRSLLCVPLRVRDRAIGAIELINKLDGPFTEHDLDLLVTLGASVAAAIENARLFLELTVANADLEASRSEIERSRSTLLALFDNLDDELYIVNRSYDLVAVNRTRADRRGEDPRQLVGRRCYRILEDQDGPCPGCRVMDTFERRVKTKRTERIWGPDQQMRELEIYTYPILGGQGEVSHTILQTRDVTEQRRLEASLAQAEKLAAVGQLAAGVAHELNNPLTAVIANTQLIRRDMGDCSEHRESLELIERAGKRAQEVVRDLLNFARQERWEYNLVDVNASIRHALSLIERQWSASNINLQMELAEGLPPVRGNGDRLQSVWLNLLVNARDALEGKPGSVTIRSRHEQDVVVVQVVDDGVGIPPASQTKVFEPFFTTKHPGRGTGLGLATCYRIVKQHSGTIQIDSQPNEGTTVTVELPAAAVSP